MEKKQFKLINNILSVVVLVIASITYIMTVEPTTSFWDCGEFIASSYKLEVGHPPGNPVFQLIARFFTMFASSENAAYAVNIMSALCSAFTIFFLYLTIVHLGRRLLEKSSDTTSLSSSIALLGAGVIGSLAFCFSDSFWFSAVEAEVYAMSSLFTAVVFWAMLKWEEDDSKYANRWIILIAFLMGLSIGVHLLNLLAIPAIAFIYYYKRAKKITWKNSILVLLISGVILAAILYVIIPYLPKLAAITDLLFVNGFGLPFNSGAAFFMVLFFCLCFWAIYYTFKKGKTLANTIILGTTMIIVGFSLFSVVIIRSSAKTPTNEYQPDNPYTLIRYLNREQYGSRPLIYGETYATPWIEFSTSTYWTELNGKYHKAPSPWKPIYDPQGKMLFPRMWSNDASHIEFYKSYTSNKGKILPRAESRIPTMGDNLSFFFDYQLNFMYWRYFMWNFAGRQNDLHAAQRDLHKGNWESGIGFIDRARLGDQSGGPDYISNSRSKNHYYMLPLLLGLIGLFYQLGKDQRNWWITALLFILTGIAIVVYISQSPFQVRERDYSYAGSFYAFTIWIGLGVIALYQILSKYLSKIKVPSVATACAVTLITLYVPIKMAAENWDDHDRSNRYTARDHAYNFLMSTDENAILVTHGDNDTFPLWYMQEVEELRLDVRIMNTSLLGTDWYIDQMKQKMYDSEPVKLSIDRSQYLYGTNEGIFIEERINRPITVKEVIEIFKNPKIKANYSGEIRDYIPVRTLKLPVNKENVLKYGIVNPKDADKILDTLTLQLSPNKNSISKVELMILDMLANYDWDRPIYFLGRGGGDVINIGIRDYLQFDGLAYKFVPIKSSQPIIGEVGQIDSEKCYDKIMNVYRWDSFNDPTINIDYQHLFTFNAAQSLREIFINTAQGLLRDGEIQKAVEILDKMQEVAIPENFPLNTSDITRLNEMYVLDAIKLYLMAGEQEKAVKLANAFMDETIKHIYLYAREFKGAYMSYDGLSANLQFIMMLSEIYDEAGLNEIRDSINQTLREIWTELELG